MTGLKAKDLYYAKVIKVRVGGKERIVKHPILTATMSYPELIIASQQADFQVVKISY